MREFFYSIAANPTMLGVADFLNVWGLIAIGLGLILGAFTNISVISGIVLLSLYYLSHPPFVSLKYSLPMEGSYLFVNKNLIELTALVILFLFPTGKLIGLDRLIFSFQSKNRKH
jgi:thiosulfate dehydrogenase [quinone] large subunit